MGTGGIRYGAGRPASKGKAEHCLQIDVRRWQRLGVLQSGRSGSWQWTNRATGEQRGSIGYQAGTGSVKLTYSIDGRPCAQTVFLSSSACNLGGTRPWFVCPIRGERVAVLFLRAGRFACRHCQRLAYSSQSCDSLDRTWLRQHTVEAKLGANWQRPKGMHKATHQRLMSIIWDCEQRRDAALSGYLAATMRRHPSLQDDLKRWT